MVLSRWCEGDAYAALLEEGTSLVDTMDTDKLAAWASQRLDVWTQDHLVPWRLPKADRMRVARTIAAAAGLVYFKRVLRRDREPASDAGLVPRWALKANQIAARLSAPPDE